MSPYSHLHGHSFDYSFLCTFGCFVLFPSFLMSGINFLPKPKNASFSSIALHIRISALWSCYQSTLHFPACSFFENISYYHSSHIQGLSFLDTFTSSKSFTFPVLLTYLLYPFLSHHHIFHSLSLSPCLWMLLLLVLYYLWLLWLSRVISFLLAKIHTTLHRPARYCASANTTYSPKFSSFVSALHSLQEPKSYSEVVSLQNGNMQWMRN